MKLILKLIAGIIAGIIIGLFVPEFLIRLLITVKLIFGHFIGFVIPFIVFFFIASGISGLGKQSGNVVGFTVGIAYLSTLLAGLLAFLVASNIIPLFSPEKGVISDHVIIPPFFDIEIAPIMSVMTALISAFLFGIGIAKTDTLALKKVLDEGKNVIDLVITKIIIPFLPFYIASIFANLTAEGAIAEVLSIFAVVLLLAITLHWVWLTLLYVIAGLLCSSGSDEQRRRHPRHATFCQEK
jgi:Na+/H+-dicarboxylate symporter